jgi:hypothetical protein
VKLHLENCKQEKYTPTSVSNLLRPQNHAKTTCHIQKREHIQGLSYYRRYSIISRQTMDSETASYAQLFKMGANVLNTLHKTRSSPARWKQISVQMSGPTFQLVLHQLSNDHMPITQDCQPYKTNSTSRTRNASRTYLPRIDVETLLGELGSNDGSPRELATGKRLDSLLR